MKFIHASDLHLGRFLQNNDRKLDFFKSFKHILKTANQKKVDYVLIAGDFFDKKDIDPEVLETTEQILDEFYEENQIKIIVIEGNHDRAQTYDHRTWLEYLNKKEKIILLDSKIEDNQIKFREFDKKTREGAYITHQNHIIAGIGYKGGAYPKYLQEFYQFAKKNPEKKITLLIHSAFSDNDFIGLLDRDLLKDIPKNVKYLALGHLHNSNLEEINKDNEKTILALPGCPESWNSSEYNYKKRFYYTKFNDEDIHVEEITSTKRNSESIDFILKSKDDLRTFKNQIDTKKETKTKGIQRKEELNIYNSLSKIKKGGIYILNFELSSLMDFDIAEIKSEIIDKYSPLDIEIKLNFNLKGDSQSLELNESEILQKELEGFPKSFYNKIIHCVKDNEPKEYVEEVFEEVWGEIIENN